MSKLTEAERVALIKPEIEKLRTKKPQDITPLDDIERIDRELRAKYPGREFCFSAVRQKDGSYEISIDDVKAEKPKEKR